MTTKQKFEELKQLSLLLNSFLEYCEKNPEFMETIEAKAIIDQIHKDLNPILRKLLIQY